MAPRRSLSELNDDLAAEILLRVGPDEPDRLLRVSLACKCWRRILCDPVFLRSYRAFHQLQCPPPGLLGFFYNLDFPGPFSSFVATTPEAFALPLRGFNHRRVSWALDSRHGRVLFKKTGSRGLLVWDPISNVWTDLPPPSVSYESYSAVVLCDVAGCDHRRGGCGGGRFLVVCIGCDAISSIVYACVYSSEGRTWGAPVSNGRKLSCFDVKRPADLIGDGIYCTVGGDYIILKYDLVRCHFSLIDMPYWYSRDTVLMQNEDGTLGLAGVRGTRLYLWSRIWNGNAEEWVQWRIIKLRKMLPAVDDRSAMKANVIGFAEGVGVFFLRTSVGIFTVELDSGRVMKVSGPSNNYRTAFPFITYFTPGPDHA